jgi:GTP-binding protein
MFKDEGEIEVHAGDGGRGCVAFRREKYVPRGGPNGGDGGAGGSVYVESTSRLNTLYHLHFRKLWKASRGEHGMGSNCSGRNGEDQVIELPVGSIVRDAESGMILADLVEEGQRVCVAKGGRGGLGNQHFATSTNQAPRYAQPGEEGESRRIQVELKLIADVGLVGLPNAGKSTLISVISAARPKIADYPFTTLIPNLGVVAMDTLDTFVVADIPGLIEGAHEGHGLGDKFLRHVERCSLLLHLVDLSQSAKPSTHAAVIDRELSLYSGTLAEKRRIVCGTKIDSRVDGASQDLREWAERKGYPYLEISAVVGTNMEPLKYRLAEEVKSARQSEAAVDVD